MKVAGLAYLLWLAFNIARSGPPKMNAGTGVPTGFLGRIGLLWLNPKGLGWALTLGAAASFATLAGGPLQLALVLGSAFGLAAALSLSLWYAAGLMLARLLRTERQWRVLNVVLSLLLVTSIVPMWLD